MKTLLCKGENVMLSRRVRGRDRMAMILVADNEHNLFKVAVGIRKTVMVVGREHIDYVVRDGVYASVYTS